MMKLMQSLLTEKKDVSGSSVLHKIPERSKGKNKSDKINKASRRLMRHEKNR
jgi:hypothetical protein